MLAKIPHDGNYANSMYIKKLWNSKVWRRTLVLTRNLHHQVLEYKYDVLPRKKVPVIERCVNYLMHDISILPRVGVYLFGNVMEHY